MMLSELKAVKEQFPLCLSVSQLPLNLLDPDQFYPALVSCQHFEFKTILGDNGTAWRNRSHEVNDQTANRFVRAVREFLVKMGFHILDVNSGIDDDCRFIQNPEVPLLLVMLIVYLANDRDYNRIGISISRKLKGAVTRNRIKRIFKESFRLNRSSYPDKADIVIAVRPGFSLDSPDLITKAVVELIAPCTSKP